MDSVSESMNRNTDIQFHSMNADIGTLDGQGWYYTNCSKVLSMSFKSFCPGWSSSMPSSCSAKVSFASIQRTNRLTLQGTPDEGEILVAVCQKSDNLLLSSVVFSDQPCQYDINCLYILSTLIPTWGANSPVMRRVQHRTAGTATRQP